MAQSLIPDSNKTKHCNTFPLQWKIIPLASHCFSYFQMLLSQRIALSFLRSRVALSDHSLKNLTIIYTDLNVDAELELSTGCSSFLEECSWMVPNSVYSCSMWGKLWHLPATAQAGKCQDLVCVSLSPWLSYFTPPSWFPCQTFTFFLKEKLAQSLAQCRTMSLSVPAV